MFVLNACIHMTHIGYHTLSSSGVMQFRGFVSTIYTSSNLYFNKPCYFPGNHFCFCFFLPGPQPISLPKLKQIVPSILERSFAVVGHPAVGCSRNVSKTNQTELGNTKKVYDSVF